MEDISGAYFLANSGEYNLVKVVMLVKKNGTRLAVVGDDGILKNEEYKTEKGAKIAFANSFNKRVKGQKSVKPEWLKASFENLED
jgi:hypothetical protein